MLLVLDNCEHVIEAAADVAVRILRGAPGVRILATSREVLRAEGEHVHRLPPLACPPPSAGLTAADALRFPAVQLFVEREAAFLGEFELADHDAPLVADICRRLDGLPLAIELAAARVDALGLRGLTMHLDDRLQMLTGGRRPAVPRHQSLRATLEWSHQLLSRPERAVFRRLAIFADGFTLAAAGAIAASAEIGAPEVVECVANLVAKSIVAADVDRAVPSYRLVETTRAYALEKLHESGEFEQVQHRHAAYFEGSLQSGRMK
jgi:predicted ATPase